MILKLNLENVLPEYHEAFCQYLIFCLQEYILTSGEQSKYGAVENYINQNNLIKWIVNKHQPISVYELYRLAVSNLKIRQVDDYEYEIYLDENQNIPNSYTTMYSIIKLLEYGTLSMRKVGELTKAINTIDENIDAYYKKFLMRISKFKVVETDK